MEEQANSSEQHQLDLDESESKSPLSQESGLCSTMLVTEESMGSLDELSESVHQQLDSHIDQSTMLQYEVDLLRSQLAQKNRVITTQQVTIKQLQEALLAGQREITCKNETINILQSDLVDCQQQYAECFQQVVQQDRVLSEIRDDDAVLIQKIAFLEKQFRKTNRTISTQTEPSLTHSSSLTQGTSTSEFFSTHSQLRSSYGGCIPRSLSEQRRSFCLDVPNVSTVNCASPLANRVTRTPSPTRAKPSVDGQAQESITAAAAKQLKDLMAEIREIQATLQPKGCHQQEERANPTFHRHSQLNESEFFAKFWNAFTEERQQRIKLDHTVRQMELDLLEVKNQVQSCRARLASQQDASSHATNVAWHNSSKICCPLMEQAVASPPVPRNSSYSSATLYTLV